MRFCVTHTQRDVEETDNIYGCFDEVIEGFSGITFFIERKAPFEDRYPDERSVTQRKKEYILKGARQLAVYYAFYQKADPVLKQANFVEGSRKLELRPTSKHGLLLQVGRSLFTISVENPELLRQYYMTKLRASKDYSKSRSFDEYSLSNPPVGYSFERLVGPKKFIDALKAKYENGRANA